MSCGNNFFSNCALVGHRQSFTPPSCRTSQYRSTFVPPSYLNKTTYVS